MGLCYWESDVNFHRNWRLWRAELVAFGKEDNAFALQGTEFQMMICEVQMKISSCSWKNTPRT